MPGRKKVKIEAKELKKTFTSLSYLQKLKSCLSTPYGILLIGEAGCGKSSLLSLFSQEHNKTLLKVYIDSSLDSKTLLGTYICGEVPGEFLWKIGILAQAVVTGSWIVFENIDRMGEDITALLSNLILTNVLDIPNRGEQLVPVSGFKVFATATSVPNDVSKWVVIRMNSLSKEDLWEISPVLWINDDSIQKLFESIHFAIGNLPGRPVVTNDWIKFTKRCCFQIEKIYGHKGVLNSMLTENCRELVFLTAMSVYSGIRNPSLCIPILSQILGLNSLSIEALYYNRSVSIELANSFLKLGISPPLPISSLNQSDISLNNYTLKILENLCSAVAFNEGVLLVGETGCGKTTLVQYLAKLVNTKLYVHNLSQMSDSSDIIGGFKPIGISSVLLPIMTQFFLILPKLCNIKENTNLISALKQAYSTQKWEKMVDLFSKAVAELQKTNPDNFELENFKLTVEDAKKKLKNSQFAFQFVEGSLVKALKEGSWILLEEINLAEEEVLERLHSVIEGNGITLIEKADIHSIVPNTNFKLFGCMNPGKQIGKKDLPQSLRSKFTEIWVPEMENFEDILNVVKYYLEGKTDRKTMDNIVKFYLEMRRLSKEGLIEDGNGRAPQYSMRTLCRALKYALEFAGHYSFAVSLYNGLKVFFETPLTVSLDVQLASLSPCPTHALSSLGKTHVNVLGFWHEKGPKNSFEDPLFILTPSVKSNLMALSRATIYNNNAILLEGPTSTGKTSMVKYLAELLGHQFIRINNHEHTDIEEYIGSYVSDSQGRLVFSEGPLVTAVKNGYFLVLDELNLAPSEVLEALNRLLDDNKELFITETQTTIKPHKNFRLFATQNPTGYAGRKELSKAFRNRFVEMFIGELPDNELIQILETKGKLAPSYSQVLISIMRDLQRHRQQTRAFLGKQGFITIRDLLKIAKRGPVGYDQLGIYTYLILAERLRTIEEKNLVKEIIEKHCKRIKINILEYYENYFNQNFMHTCETIVWNSHMKRLFCLVNSAILNNEPVLLIGETGCGKTSICQALSLHNNKNLRILNCHQHTETSDFLGSLRPVRNKSILQSEILNDFQTLYPQHCQTDKIEEIYETLTLLNIKIPKAIQSKIKSFLKIFEWVDGPLVNSFINGEYFLIDEISLADDSVLERLNSVLEPERKLLISEKADNEEIQATEGFQIFATMNPGGDYGKKELSPALRNRFTEIWVSITISDIKEILATKMASPQELLEFIDNYNKTARVPISLRDALVCADFISQHNIPNALWESLSLILPKVPNLPKPELLLDIYSEDSKFGILPYTITSYSINPISYSFTSPTVLNNLYNLLRGMQLNKAILLEGPPGVGKTSIIESLGKVVGHTVIRVNLSEETDLIDLLGCDLPCGDKFLWCDGVLLNAIKNGHWVILDELNLCPQQVIEGLNALLDHRATVFIPEINLEVQCAKGFRLFAAQNPVSQGGGRKGLPKSFLNRFTKIYMEELLETDYQIILSNMYPGKNTENIVKFNSNIRKNIEGPWEFNLRDMLRYCDEGNIETLYYYRLRTDIQRSILLNEYKNTFENELKVQPVPFFHITPTEFVLKDLVFDIQNLQTGLEILPGQLNILHEISVAIKKSWALLVVGKQGCGKNSLIRLAASLHKKKLLEYSLSPNTDSTQLLGSFEQNSNGKFEWFESLLIKSIKQGDWVLLKNCNKCPAAVLDRINSLLEPNGKLLINERGLVNGESYLVSPSSDFRIFFTYNPHVSEVSRALRNRCVELYLDSCYSFSNLKRLFNMSFNEFEMVKDKGLAEIGKWKEISKIINRNEAFALVYEKEPDTSQNFEFCFQNFNRFIEDSLQAYWTQDTDFLNFWNYHCEAKECFVANACVADISKRSGFIECPEIELLMKKLNPFHDFLPIFYIADSLQVYLEISLKLSKIHYDLKETSQLMFLWLIGLCDHSYPKYKFSKSLPLNYQFPSPIDIGLLKSWKSRVFQEIPNLAYNSQDSHKILTNFEFSQLLKGIKVIFFTNRVVVKAIEEDLNEIEIGVVASKESFQSEERVFLEEVYEIYEQILFRHLVECIDNNISYNLPLSLYPKSYLKAVWILSLHKNSIREITIPILKVSETSILDFLGVFQRIKGTSIIDAPKYWFIGNNMLKWPRPKTNFDLPKEYTEGLVLELDKYCESDSVIQKFLSFETKTIGLGLWLYKLYRKINMDPANIYIELVNDYNKILLTTKEKNFIRNKYHEIKYGWECQNSIIDYYSQIIEKYSEKLLTVRKKVKKRTIDTAFLLEKISTLPSYER